MSEPQSKPEIIDQLRLVQHGVSETVQGISAARFEQGTAQAWSPGDYLKHLLLSVKPFAKAVGFPPAALRRRFGEVSQPPQSYGTIVAAYQARLAQGIRAEDYEAITPGAFRVPEGTVDLKAYLVGLWDDAHERMITGLAQWSEADLDTIQIMHPALGSVSVREMCFFTIAHNKLHWNDIRVAAGL